MSRILIIEDNPDLAFGLRRTLEFEGYEVEVADDGETGLERIEALEPDLVLLDLMLPGKGGFEILRELRGDACRVPVLVLTARGEESDIVLGFDSGADDYVTKPFSTLELLARVRALLRRRKRSAHSDSEGADRPGSEPGGNDAGDEVRDSGSARGPGSTDGRHDGTGRRDSHGTWTFADVEVDPAARTVHRGGEPVPLTPKEFDLLVALFERAGAVASRSELLDEVWGYANPDVQTRTVDIHMAELRRKLEEDPSDPRHLLTVRKAGYRLDA